MDQSTSKKQGYDDRPFLCAAVFRALMEGNLDTAEEKNRYRLKSRFDAMYALGKHNLARIGGTEDDARDVLQKYVELTADFAVKKKDKFADLILYCARLSNAPMERTHPEQP